MTVLGDFSEALTLYFAKKTLLPAKSVRIFNNILTDSYSFRADRVPRRRARAPEDRVRGQPDPGHQMDQVPRPAALLRRGLDVQDPDAHSDGNFRRFARCFLKS